MKKCKKLLLATLCVVLILTSFPLMIGCAAKEPAYLFGTVELNRPIAEATISIYDTTGKLLYKVPNETSSNGVFVLKITKPLPESFRIEAIGGRNTANDEPFDGVLTAEIRNYDEQSYPSISLGPISTLIASYMKTHSGISYEDAQNKVLVFLNLEPSTNIMQDMLSIKNSIHPAVFEAKANEAGGFDKFITLLVNHIDVDGGKYSDMVSAPFGAGPVTLGFGEEIAKTLILKLVEGFATKVGGESAGWLIDQIRGGDTSGSSAKAIADMSVRLDQISSQISDLDNKLTKGIEELRNQAERINYEQASRGIQAPISVIETSLGYLRNITRLDPKKDDFKASLQYYIDKIDTTAIEQALLQINNVLVGQQGVRGITQIWGEMELQYSINSYKSDKYPALASQFEYYASLQLAGLTVLIDKYHAESTPAQVKTNNVETAMNNYKSRILAQGDQFLTSVESILAWHCTCWRSNHPVYQKEWNFTWEFRTSWPVIENVLVESATLDKADTLLGNFIGQTKSVVIRMYSYNKDLTNDMGFFEICLDYGSSRNQRTEYVKPEIFTIHFPPVGDGSCPRPLNNPGGYSGQIVRFTFSDLEPGTYYIHDDNKDWKSPPLGSQPRVYMINSKLMNLPFVVSDKDPYHNQLIYPWLSETGY